MHVQSALQIYARVYEVLIEHTCLTKKLLILLCVLVLLCSSLVVYYRAENFISITFFCLKIQV